ncbi:hypothetical protein RHHCN13_02025 [Rickettsia conorii subsp. heilongjiangensis]|uniref:Uncharacterized protein n=1 Tax=Rickettsia conorii subsp. heilongjiangensis TaxID=226665 RepID=A0AAD1GI70_RICCR|nr:hypothetical protein [Rickettsia conorii]AEK74417.1 hypothetical protein Rh054_02135 [Rickettsia conorii subsp. heilongjiangensis 054]BBM91189.1 hypothetical protein RHCH81_02025 [Rickettsia conorii subsp. heilongjiangensis]BBM92398.1 hypothetical protein RHHCN13_02025 [Rickettsia conorii subsp. heilongjiangensis]BBM93607.1 hypothetical protein RHSENDAI29_02025 [Rickettsia conorii subsp. heilongjiangensis]BBM94816.1 hypothetical protein RHSENDAI58_02025 [Rickettsia conorii subsp. heilongjia
MGNSNNEILYQATRSLTEMLSVMHEQEALNTLQYLLNDSNIYIKATAVLSLELIYIVKFNISNI